MSFHGGAWLSKARPHRSSCMPGIARPFAPIQTTKPAKTDNNTRPYYTRNANNREVRATFSRSKMASFVFLPALLLLCNVGSSSSTSLDLQGFTPSVIDSKLLSSKIETNRTILVGKSGKEDFTSVQAAVDHVPEGNSDWVIIHVRAGNYREKVVIPSNKPYVFLRGNGKGKTFVTHDDSAKVNAQSAVFTIKASNVVVFGISFKNEAPIGELGAEKNRSVAAYVAADKVAFYHCGFYSSHNTLFDAKGRHYYANCYITGSIDFIFGHGRSIFKSCELFVVADKRTTVRGSITAHYRADPNEQSGFIFLKGKVYGIGQVYMGRARAAYSRVIFAKTYLSKTIDPEGWTNWSYDESVEHLSLGEYHCHGPGAEIEERVKWSRQLNDTEVAPFMSIDFISGKEWLPTY